MTVSWYSFSPNAASRGSREIRSQFTSRALESQGESLT